MSGVRAYTHRPARIARPATMPPSTKSIPEPTYEVTAFGQIFTPPAIVDCMRKLVRNNGRVLEPACGDGAFLQHFPGALGIEIDPRHAPPGAEVMDFFELSDDESFATIIGNPPYVRYQDISPGTRRLARGTCSTSARTFFCSSSRSVCACWNPAGS